MIRVLNQLEIMRTWLFLLLLYIIIIINNIIIIIIIIRQWYFVFVTVNFLLNMLLPL